MSKKTTPRKPTRARKATAKPAEKQARDRLEWAHAMLDAFGSATDDHAGVGIIMVHANPGFAAKLEECKPDFNPALPGLCTGLYGDLRCGKLENLASRRRWFTGNPLSIAGFLDLAEEAGQWLNALDDDEREPLHSLEITPESWMCDGEHRWIWSLFDLAWMITDAQSAAMKLLSSAIRRTWSNEFCVSTPYDDPEIARYSWAHAAEFAAQEPKLFEEEVKRGSISPAGAARQLDQGRRFAQFCQSDDVVRWLSRPGPPDWYFSEIPDVLAASAVAMQILIIAIWGADQFGDNPGLSRGKEDVLRVMLAHDAVTPDRRMTNFRIRSALAKLPSGRSSTNERVASLSESGYLATRKGRTGGNWLLPLGVRTAKRLPPIERN